ncbi:MAG: type II toxin-antitoxin system RelE/ParE family toxin [Acidobacteriaceae bacterium]
MLRLMPKAQEHLAALHAYIAEDNESAARRMVDRILNALENLEGHPMMGRRGRVSGTRELVLNGTPYIVVYRWRARKQVIEIDAVLHAARRWPSRF